MHAKSCLNRYMYCLYSSSLNLVQIWANKTNLYVIAENFYFLKNIFQIKKKINASLPDSEDVNYSLDVQVHVCKTRLLQVKKLQHSSIMKKLPEVCKQKDSHTSKMYGVKFTGCNGQESFTGHFISAYFTPICTNVMTVFLERCENPRG